MTATTTCRLLALAAVALVAQLLPAIASARSVTSVYCAAKGPLVKPAACEFYSRYGLAGTFVTGMRWSKWAGSTAIASGTFRGNMNYTKRVRVRLSGPQLCQPGQSVYTVAEFKFKGASKWSGGRIVGCDGTSGREAAQ